MQKLLVITGPTASGKTDLAIELAKKINGAIISADSRQVYIGMNIGTGKPTELGGIPHYLFDVVNPEEEFTVAHWKKLTLSAIQEIHHAGKTPMLVGGTGLYIRSVVENLEIPAVAPNLQLRDAFEKDYALSKEPTLKKWGDKLRVLDPNADIDFKNPRRLIRALEIVMATGLPLDEAQKKGPQLFETLELGINVERDKLYARIDTRVDAMITDGLENEVRELLKKYPSFFSFPASESPGYAEWQDYFAGEVSIADTITKIKFNTHAYARRQMTWFNKNNQLQWIQSFEQALPTVEQFLQ